MRTIILILSTFLIFPSFINCTGGKQEDKKSGAADEEYISEEKRVDDEVENYWSRGEINEFLIYASMVNKMQLLVSEMAMEKAATEKVRQYANIIHEDHKLHLQNLKQILDDRDMNVPDTLSQRFNNIITELQNSSGAEFDRQFVDFMIEDHKKAIAKYENAKAHILQEGPIYAWLDNSLPALHRHEQKGQQVERLLKEPQEEL
ncbi:MAG: DUF4142 domain-containing protein [Candidatus Cyclobacteriaceae bacterium M2_1C_046]